MRKNLPVITILVLTILSLTSCSADNKSYGSNNTTIASTTAETQNISSTESTEINITTKVEGSAKAEVSVSEQILLDQNGVKITLNSLDNDAPSGSILKLLIENNSDKNVTIQSRDVSVNNIMTNNVIFSPDVQAGTKVDSDFAFSKEDFDIAGISTIKNIQLRFLILDSSTSETIYDSDIVNIETTADPSYVQTYDDSGFVALNQDGFKVVVKENVKNTGFGWSDIYIYIENNSDKNITVELKNTLINGSAIDSMFYCDVAAGKKAIDYVSFFDADLNDNGIEKIESLTSSYVISDSSYNTILSVDNVVVNFK